MTTQQVHFHYDVQKEEWNSMGDTQEKTVDRVRQEGGVQPNR